MSALERVADWCEAEGWEMVAVVEVRSAATGRRGLARIRCVAPHDPTREQETFVVERGETLEDAAVAAASVLGVEPEGPGVRLTNRQARVLARFAGTGVFDLTREDVALAAGVADQILRMLGSSSVSR